METVKKITKKDQYTVMFDIIRCAENEGFQLPEGITYDSLREFIDHELKLLNDKTIAAQKRAAQKRAEGDELREKVFNVLSNNDFMTISDVVKKLDDPDVSAQMVTSRLTQLVNLERVEKDFISITTESGKTKKLSGYKAKSETETI